jgi:hypothetical protein
MTETDWQETAVRMRREQQAATADIAEAVGRSESQVRRVLAKANAERAINGAPSSNGNGPHDVIPGQTTVDDHLEPEDDPESPGWAGRDEFVDEAGESVGPMPPSRAVDAQDGMFDVVWDDATLLDALEAREKTREAKLTAGKAHKLKDDAVKALLDGKPLEVGAVARIGRFRIKKTRREGNEVSFTTEPREQLSIAVDPGD